jgi:hypothetical protein
MKKHAIKFAMISQPMNGLSDDDIMKVRNNAIENLRDKGYTVINSYFNYDGMDKDLNNDGIKSIPIWFLGHAVEAMSKVDCAYFTKGWDKARGCKVEHEIAKLYDIPIFYEEEV